MEVHVVAELERPSIVEAEDDGLNSNISTPPNDPGSPVWPSDPGTVETGGQQRKVAHHRSPSEDRMNRMVVTAGGRGRRRALGSGLGADEAERLTDAMISSLRSNSRRPTTGSKSLAVTIRGALSLLALIALIVFELTIFELDDWEHKPSPVSDALGATDKGPMGKSGFTGPTMLWAFSTLVHDSAWLFHCRLF